MSSAEVFVENAENAMPMKLAELGFDVWLGNNRGNIYSRGHVYWKAQDNYFQYSFLEMGKWDITKMIEHAK